MPDPIQHKLLISALAGAKSGTFGNAKSGSGTITLRAHAECAIILALAAPGATDIASALASVAPNAPFGIRPAAPGQWLIVRDAPLLPGELAALEKNLGGAVALLDQSHGRVRIGIEGRDVEAVLAKLTAVDLDPARFPVGHSATTLAAHVGAHITRTGEDRFEILVTRSFAAHLWDELIEMARPFGVVATAA